MSYPSDADVLFVYEPPAGMPEDAASGAAHAVAEELRRLLSMPAPDPPLGVDADLRPEGRQGPLVRSLAAVQALLRPLVEGVGGAGAAAGPVRVRRRRGWPAGSWSWPTGCGTRPAASPASRSPRSAGSRPGSTPNGCPAAPTRPPTPSWGAVASPTSNGPSSCSSCATATRYPGLRTTRTLDALAAAADAGLVDRGDAAVLAAAWRMATRVRNALILVRGRAADQLPRHGPELAGVVARPRPAGVGRPAASSSTSTCARPGWPGRRSSGSSMRARRGSRAHRPRTRHCLPARTTDGHRPVRPGRPRGLLRTVRGDRGRPRLVRRDRAVRVQPGVTGGDGAARGTRDRRPGARRVGRRVRGPAGACRCAPAGRRWCPGSRLLRRQPGVRPGHVRARGGVRCPRPVGTDVVAAVGAVLGWGGRRTSRQRHQPGGGPVRRPGGGSPPSRPLLA